MCEQEEIGKRVAFINQENICVPSMWVPRGKRPISLIFVDSHTTQKSFLPMESHSLHKKALWSILVMLKMAVSCRAPSRPLPTWDLALADLTERPGPLGYLTLQIDVKIFTVKPAVTAGTGLWSQCWGSQKRFKGSRPRLHYIAGLCLEKKIQN